MKRKQAKQGAPKRSQHQAFKEAAREHGAAESSEALERAFQKIVPPKRPQVPKKSTEH